MDKNEEQELLVEALDLNDIETLEESMTPMAATGCICG
jgi:hypothetical protein